jgi:hypothetical protein
MSREPDYWLSRRTKKAIKKCVRARPSMTENRKTKRKVRKSIKDGSIAKLGLDLPKPGKFVSERWNSSGAFKSAYSFARGEAQFYDMSRYADY